MLWRAASRGFLVSSEGEGMGVGTSALGNEVACTDSRGSQGTLVSLCFAWWIRPRNALDEVHEGRRSKFVFIGQLLFTVRDGTLPETRTHGGCSLLPATGYTAQRSDICPNRSTGQSGFRQVWILAKFLTSISRKGHRNDCGIRDFSSKANLFSLVRWIFQKGFEACSPFSRTKRFEQELVGVHWHAQLYRFRRSAL